ncbi:hypothetical protein [Rhodococcus sp. CH91]|uniref:hypothetical protein n=1 Tax=Rhodococcus sp. CH91 TaxID=2910256 RepID=UPI001F4B4296|nr:hypothetical protein [Rhodococcus sp. CH91]
MPDTTTAPAFRVSSGFRTALPQMPAGEFPDAKGYIGDVRPRPGGALAYYAGLLSVAP